MLFKIFCINNKIFCMDKFSRSLAVLDQIIAKLEAYECQKPESSLTGSVTPSLSFGINTFQSSHNCSTESVTDQRKEVTIADVRDRQKKKESKKEKNEKKVKHIEQKKQLRGEQGQQKGKTDKKQGKVEIHEKEQKFYNKEDVEPSVEDFSKIDIRIGEIVDCWVHPQSQKLYCEKINVCGQVRQIASGVQQFIPLEDMKGPIIVMVNLKPRPLAKFMSNGRVVTVSNAQFTHQKLVRALGQNSERVYLEGYEDLFNVDGIQALPQLNPKKKILEKCIDFFRTDEEGFVTWKGIRAKTSGGFIKTEIKNGIVA